MDIQNITTGTFESTPEASDFWKHPYANESKARMRRLKVCYVGFSGNHVIQGLGGSGCGKSMTTRCLRLIVYLDAMGMYNNGLVNSCLWVSGPSPKRSFEVQEVLLSGFLRVL